ncbi:MAG: hypothetical protein IT307_19020 [Chloroflexi bacterium]|nr:hypothetical protein [Chloroflexota bacterium]
MNDLDLQRLERLQERLGVRFKDLELLDQSLVHRSLLRDPGFEGRESNERLE